MLKSVSLILSTCLLLPFVHAEQKANAAPDATQPDAAAELDALRSKVQSSRTANEADAMRLIEMAEAQGRPYTAYLALKGYLSSNLDPSLRLLSKAAEIAQQVGDFRTAVGRYKAYLLNSDPNAEAADVAASMYRILIDYLGARDDAYQYMKGQGAQFRQSDSVRKFDTWFLTEAKRREDYKGLFTRLAAILSEKQPLEQERLHYWPYLDWGFYEMRRATERQFEAVPAARMVLRMIRGSKLRPLRFGLYVENAEYHANIATKSPEQQSQLYSKVIDAANGWLNASRTIDTLTQILHVLGGDTRGWFQENKWSEQEDLKRKFFMAQFTRFSSAEQIQFLQSDERDRLKNYVSANDAAILLQAHPQFFRHSSPTLDRLNIGYNTGSLDAIKLAAPALAGVPHEVSAIINPLAAGGDDFNAVLKHFFEKETWHLFLGEGRGRDYVQGRLWNGFKRRFELDTNLDATRRKQLTDWPNYGNAVVTLGVQHIAQSPAVYFDCYLASEFLVNAFLHAADDENKAGITRYIEMFDWVPWDERSRKEAFKEAHSHFKGWANNIQQLARKKRNSPEKEVTPRMLEQIGQLDAAFKRAQSIKNVDPEMAPNPLCKNLTIAVLAQRGRSNESYAIAINALYNEVKDYETKKTPWGRQLMNYVLSSGGDLETIDVKIEILADVLSRYDNANPYPVHWAFDLVKYSQPKWRNDWHKIHESHQKNIEKLNTILGQAIIKLADQGKFDAQLFDFLLYTRMGERWSNPRASLDVMEKLITKKTLLTCNHKVDPRYSNPAVSYMHLIRHNFMALNGKFPYDSYFDDMFIEAASKSGFLDYYYWSFGQDKNNKIIPAAARLLAGFETLPFGYDDLPAWEPEIDFWRWQGRVLQASEKDRAPLIKKLESLYGKSRFDNYSMGNVYFATLQKIETGEQRAAFFQALTAYVDELKRSRARNNAPSFRALLENVRGFKLSKEESDAVLRLLNEVHPSKWGDWNWFDHIPGYLQDSLLAQGREAELFSVVPEFWRIARDTRNQDLQRSLSTFANRLLDKKKYDLAAAYSNAGPEILGVALRDEFAARLTAVRSQALRNIGGAIPVKESDPRYPLFAAQASFLAGNVQVAWETALQHAGKVPAMFKELDPEFVVWLIERHTEGSDFSAAKELARSMMQWADNAEVNLSSEIMGKLYFANANIAYEQRELPLARAQYERIVANKNFDGTWAQSFAQVKVADVDRLTKQFDAAIERLERLAQRSDKFLKAEANYGLALVKYDQEEYEEAASYLNSLFSIRPDHADGRILEGRIHLKRKKLENATDLDVGLTASQRVLVPGRRLKVTIEDKNLSIVGKTTNIMIHAWTESGDEELFHLTKFGDSKTKFKGEILTALAPVKKDDGTLQVLGGDVIHFDFTEEFRKQQGLTFSTETILGIASDAELYASSGGIKTRAELEKQKLEAMIRSKLQFGKQEVKGVALNTLRPQNQVKPGNPINIRVIDLDQSTGPEADTLQARITTSSGDVVSSFPLQETGGHTGIFEGALPTSSAEASAIASDSDEGRSPNFAISSGEHPEWLARPDRSKPKSFSMDLKDNVALGEMVIKSNLAGRHITKFSLQTSLNGRDYLTVGRFPAADFQTWDGSLMARAVKFFGTEGSPPKSLEAAMGYINEGYFGKSVYPFGWKLNTAGHTSLSIRSLLDLAGIGDDDYFVTHIQGLFYNPRRQMLSFGLEMTSKSTHKKMKQRKDKLSIEASKAYMSIGDLQQDQQGVLRGILPQGVHRVDVMLVAVRYEYPDLKLLSDIGKPGNLEAFPIEYFDSNQYPEIKKQVYVPPAQIAASEDGSAYTIKFGADTRSRILRMLIEDYEGDAPAISKIELKNAEGKQVLPTKQDLLSLVRNQVLEIVPGDRITVTYRDPKTVTPANDTHEALLTATYTNAELSATFVEFTMNNKERVASYIPMRRFNPGDKVNVFISDADADVSEKLDTLKFTARASGGEEKEFIALETSEHSGVFIGGFFPVKGEPGKEHEITVKEGDQLIISYMDMENTDPGIPWKRAYAVEQSFYVDPQVRIYPATSSLLEPRVDENEGTLTSKPAGEEFYPVTRTMIATRPEEQEPEAGLTEVLLEGPLLVEVLWPTVTLSTKSTVDIFAQTSSARAKAGLAEDAPFDKNVPGTLKLTAMPSDFMGGAISVPGYDTLTVSADPGAISPIDDGRYTFSIPYALGDVPESTFVSDETADPKEEKPKLFVSGNDTVFVFFNYKNKAGEDQTVERKIKFKSDAFFSVMDRRFQQEVDSAHVGEALYLRAQHRAKDTSGEKDEITLTALASSGKMQEVQLLESYSHTGDFKGFVRLVHSKDLEAARDANTLAVNHGDTITFSYGEGDAAVQRVVTIHKGADGEVQPFSKQFKDREIAVKTQFMIAEAYFELAKMHRNLAQQGKDEEARNKQLVELSRDEIGQGKKLLEEAIHSNPDTSVKAQGEYLLANLSLEFADMTVEPDQKQRHYNDAVSRFTDLIADYPDSDYAPKSQYKKALVYEKLGDLDTASEEYVKLSYRYPDNELVAETIARLGQYFMKRGKDLKASSLQLAAEAEALGAQEMQDKKIEAEKARLDSLKTYKTAGQVFGRLAVRFPNHNLSGKTNVLSGQAFIMAEELDLAVVILRKSFETSDADKEIAATAMYWCAHAYTLMESKDGYLNAYRIFKRLTWDYPASNWAKFARGRLTEDQFQKMEDE
ncbi:MAG: hypothetical protein O3B01_24650 [Planctomycetota bacterium]|nr:hypothetical protein [Planctomycetota bacterium]